MQEITTYNNVYIENMAFVFEKCQQMEMKRLRFALEMLSGMQKILVDLVNPPKWVGWNSKCKCVGHFVLRLAQIHSNLHRHFQQTTDATIGEDLKKWSRLHGVDCATKWPEFEEYTPEFRHISSSSAKTKLKKQQEIGVVLTKKVAKGEDDQSRPTSFTNGNDDGRGRGHIKKVSLILRLNWSLVAFPPIVNRIQRTLNSHAQLQGLIVRRVKSRIAMSCRDLLITSTTSFNRKNKIRFQW